MGWWGLRAAVLGLLLAGLPAPAEVTAGVTARVPTAGIIPLSEVKAGMTGYGLTVLSGDAKQRFDVEVLGVLPNLAPGRAAILVKLSGLGLEETGVVAGMSGSPVYLDGRLAGAVAASWGFAKKPIAAVTPIEAMLPIDSDAPVRVPPWEKPLSSSTVVSGLLEPFVEPLLRARASGEEEQLSFLRAAFARFLPPAPTTRDAFSLLAPTAAGFPSETLARYPEVLGRLGLRDLAVGVTSGTLSPPAPLPSAPLSDGSSITALLVDGDIQLGVTGTVTHVLPGGRFVAFGHPFLALGDVDLPVASASVVTVLPSIFQSFKIGVPGRAAYRLTRDRDSGVAGQTDRTAPLVPVKFELRSDGGETRRLSWGVSAHPRLLASLLAISTDAALTLADPTPREKTLHYSVAVDTAAGVIRYEDESSGPRARDIALLTAATLAGVITDNDQEDPRITGIELRFASGSGERRTRLADAALLARKVEAGADVVATLRLVDRRGQETRRALRLRVPRETPEGKATLVLLDGSNASLLKFSLNPIEPRTLADFGRWVASLVPGNSLFVGILIPSRGAATGDDTVSALPPTAATLLARGPDHPPEPGRADVPARLVAQEVQTLDRPLIGSVRLEFEVERPRS